MHGRSLPGEKGASSMSKLPGATSEGLSVLPIDDHGFRDAPCICYGWPLPSTPTKCNHRSSTSSINHRWTGARGRHLLQKTSRHTRLEIMNSVVISWLRCKLSFAAVRSSIMCIRGTRSSNHGPLYTEQDHQNNHGPLQNKIIKSWTPT